MAATAPDLSPEPPTMPTRAGRGAAARFAVLTVLSLAVGWGGPFVVYWLLDRAGLDISNVAYVIILASLSITFILIGLQGIFGSRHLLEVSPAGAPFIFDHRLVVLGRRNDVPVQSGPLWAERLQSEMRWLGARRHADGGHDQAQSTLERFNLYVWRPAYVWMAMQPVPLAAFWIWRRGGASSRDWLVPLLVLAAVYLVHSAPLQTVFAYHLAGPASGRRAGWFLGDMVWSMVAGTPWRNTIARVAQLKLLLGRWPSRTSEPRPSRTKPTVIAPAPAPPGAEAPPAERAAATNDRTVSPASTTTTTPPTPEAPGGPRSPELPAVIPPEPPPAAERETAGAAGDTRSLAIRTAAELSAQIETLARQLAESTEECARLSSRADQLERALAGQDALRRSLLTTPAARIPDEDLQLLQDTMNALLADSTNLIALASISRQSQELAEIVRAYAQVHSSPD